MIQTETLNLLEWPLLCEQVATFAVTKLGAIAARNLRIPTTQAESEVLLTQTAEVTHLELDLAVNLSFEGIQDIGDALERAGRNGVLSGEELFNVATTLAGARSLRRLIDSHGMEVPTLASCIVELRTHPELEKQIHHCIDDRGKVTDRASDKLGGIRTQLKSQRDEVYRKLQRIMQAKPMAIQETVITQRDGRFVIPVKATHKSVINGIVHDLSSTGATLYIEPNAVVNGNNSLRQLQRQEQIEEERICRQLSEAVAERLEDLEQLLAIATLLDLATARARYGYWAEANRPRFVQPTAESVVLRNLRHPLLVWQARHGEGPAVVPTSLRIDPKTRVIAITGPNTGGKTVTLKTLGLAALMAKAGLYVPANVPVELPWFEQVLADIGDEQSLQQSLSTFSGHIKRIGRILAAIAPAASSAAADANGLSDSPIEPSPDLPPNSSADSCPDASPAPESLPLAQPEPVQPEPVQPEPVQPEPSPAPCPAPLANALVLLDEVGAGTDPSEGSALAIALLRHLADQTLLTVATTHFGELKALKYQDDRFENASVEFDVQTLSPTYKLLWGIPGRSNALAIAQRLGMEQGILDAAQKLVAPGASGEVNQVIAGLEAQRREQEEKAAQAAALLARAEKFYNEVSYKAAQLRVREQVLKQDQEKAIQAAVAEAKGEIAGVIRKLQRGPQLAQRAQQAREAVEAIAAQQLPEQPSTPRRTNYQPKVGERVRLLKLGNQVAEVLTNPDENGVIQVRFGILKTTASLTDIEGLNGEKAELPPKPDSQKRKAMEPQPALEPPAIRTSRNTLDIRGQRVDDAEIELDRFIAEAQGGPIWVIHGHGTGRLKRGIQDFLKQHRCIERFEPAEKADGGTGVTVAYVKG
ncbi:MAG: endonuclease MutS2 [Synechococcales cyanobacterium RM1_1_8]|nr:endonuclease MutS2 [Synechococcales cyanobacterium RM1_1_8]